MLSLCDGKVVTFVSGLCTTLDCAGGDRTRGEAQLLKIPLLPHPCLHYHFRGFGHNFDRSVLEDVSFVQASGRGAYVCLGSMCHISEQGIVKVANLQSIAFLRPGLVYNLPFNLGCPKMADIGPQYYLTV